ncbi:S-layer homology domain-containing protein [Paenibacillus sp. FSL A5-0031]|uniref:S-layer homology domain-containing protein n=1 Tax=Paenibacillus sp. FSL A5-0031 TaxID=1920420 RepID=UPI0009F8494F|nr:S-layer homology domain-containing protein [Paenibacillus sp. FSL A5-0031]
MREKSNSLFKQNSQQPHVFRGGEIKVMKKKIAAFVLATALVLPISVPAFAATPSDVVGKPVQSAVEELTALGIIAGYEDGTFKPDNTITRAELAKVIVIGSGNEGAAKLMQNVKPTFKDVKANVWYTGYINAAATKGFILGDAGTKNFRPSDAVKFEEVVAVLVRSLGYQEKKLSGVWPYNYLLKAEDIGLFNNVDLNVGAKAVRGVVAQMTSNTLNAKLVSYNVDGNEVLSNSALISKLGNTSSAELLAASVVDGKVKLRWTQKNTAGNDELKTDTIATASNFIVTGGKSLVDLLGHNVTVVKNKDGKIVAITDAQDTAATLTGTLEADQVAGSVKIKVGSDVKTKATVASTVYFVNGQETALSTASTGDTVTLYLVNDQVRVATAEKWSIKDALVTSVEEKTAYRDARVNTNQTSAFINDSTSVTIDGKVAKVTDLKKDDVISVVSKSGNVAIKVVVVRNTATGKLEFVGSSNGTAKYTVAGKVYEKTANAVNGDIATLIATNVGKEFTLLLNADGKIVKATAPEAAVNKPFVVVLEAKPAQQLENEEFIQKTKVTYFDVKANKNEVKYTDFALLAKFQAVQDQLVELVFNDSKLTDVTAKTNVKDAGYNVSKVSATEIVLDTPSAANPTKYIINANTVVIDATKLGATDLADRKLVVGTLAQVTRADKVYVNASGATANYIILKTDTDANAEAGPAIYGLFVSADKQSSATTSTYTVTLNVNNQNVTTEVIGAAFNNLNDNNINGALKNKIVKLVDLENTSKLYDTATVVGTALETITIANNQNDNTFGSDNGNYILTPNTVVYVISTDGTIYTGTYTDVKDQKGTIGSSTSTASSVTVATTGSKYDGDFNEAAVIVIKRK